MLTQILVYVRHFIELPQFLLRQNFCRKYVNRAFTKNTFKIKDTMLHVLQNGYPKCGNQWLYEIITRALAAAGLPQSSYLSQLPVSDGLQKLDMLHGKQGREAQKDVISIEEHGCFVQVRSVFRWPINDLDDYVDQCSHVWSHSAWTSKTADVYGRFEKVIYILRDPRDVACSMSRFMFAEYNLLHRPHGYSDPDSWLADNFESMLKQWQDHVIPHLVQAEAMNLHIIFYENLYRDFDHEFSRLLNYLGISLNDSDITAIRDDVSFGTMKNQFSEHLQKGGFGGWKKRLSDRQVDLCAGRLGALLKSIGYPVTRNDEYGRHLAQPASLSQVISDTAIPSFAANKRSRLWDTTIRQAYGAIRKRLR